MAVTPQLPPTDIAALEAEPSREIREKQYAEQQIYKHDLPQGTRYAKGTDEGAPRRSWQSLDVVLRSDENSAAALPTKQLRRSRLFAALTVAAGILAVAGAAASAREGLNLGDVDPAGGVLLGGGLATVGFAITSGVFYGKSRQGYERAVDVYNDSLGMRLGVLDAQGSYRPAPGAVLDADGNVMLDPGDEAVPVASGAESAPAEPEPEPEPEPDTVAEPEVAEPAPAEASPAEAPAEPTAEPPAEPEAAPEPEATSVSVPEPGPGLAALPLSPRL